MQLIFLLLLIIIYFSVASEPVIVEADSLERDDKGVITATGNVNVVYGGKTLKSQKIVYDTSNKRIEIPSKFYIKTERFEGEASNGWWDIENDEGEAYNFQGVMDGAFYVKGSKLKKRKDEYNFKDLEFSSCPFQQRDWYLKTFSGHAKEGDKLQVYHTFLRFCKIPILYTPYFSYPLTDRKTGLLPPYVGRDTYNTFILKAPFFYAINDYSDLTLTADYRNNQGKGLSTEYRRLFDERSYLNFHLDFFREEEDRVWWQRRFQTPITQRWRLKVESNYSPFEDWKFYSKLDFPSDRYFFEDFYNMSPLRYTSFTRSYMVGRRDYGEYLTEINFDYYYDLTKPNNKQTIQRLPELRIYKKPENLISENLYYDFTSESNHFYSETLNSGIRTDNIFRVYGYNTFGTLLNMFQFMPRLTIYINTKKDDNTIDSRILLPIKDTIQTNIIKSYGGFTHSVIPRITFEYISKVNQSKLPYYDREDRVSEKKDIDISIFNILNFKSDLYLRWEVSTGYTLLGAYTVGENSYLSNIKPLKNGLLFNLNRVSADSISYYDMEKGYLLRTVSSITFIPKSWLVYSLSYIQDRSTQSSKQLLNSFSINSQGINLSLSTLNNLSQGHVQRKTLSLAIDRKCWNLSLSYYQDYNFSTNRKFSSFVVMINIMGNVYRIPFIKN